MIRFDGLAPIPAGSNVIMFVDNPDKPKTAYSIFDQSHGITFTSSEPEKPQKKVIATTQAIPDYVSAKVVSTRVHVLNNETELVVSGMKRS